MKGIVATLSLSLMLAGCATTGEPVIRTIEVKVPVAVDCVPVALSDTPSYPDTDAALRAATDAAERYRLVAAGRLLRDARLGELEPIIKACQKSEITSEH
jgi:hypothetical protein